MSLFKSKAAPDNRLLKEHQWVKHLVIPVQVVSNFETSLPNAVMLNTDIDRALVEAVVGCQVCSAPLNTETVNTRCPGYDE